MINPRGVGHRPTLPTSINSREPTPTSSYHSGVVLPREDISCEERRKILLAWPSSCLRGEYLLLHVKSLIYISKGLKINLEVAFSSENDLARFETATLLKNDDKITNGL